MGRRGLKEAELSSDSFLDILCNMVGILVILMVIAGVQVSRAPVTVADIDPDASAPIATHPGSEPPSDEPWVAPPDELVADVPPEGPAEIAPPAPAGPSPELVDQADSLEREIAALAAAASEQAAELTRRRSREAALQARLAQLSDEIAQQAALAEGRREDAAALQQAINVTAAELAETRRQLETLEKSKPAAQKIEHKVTPVSRTVVGTELHFHLGGGKVTPVPLDDLTDRLREQVQRQKEWLAKYRRHQGEVGPISGFTMRYVVEREELSVVDELRQGTAMMKIGVSQWELVPDANLPGETSGQALKSGSKFQRTLRQAKADASLTFWVYPDSFALCRDLTAFAHQQGFTVAARPLPRGMPIAGSPNGTRSSGQ